MSNNQDATAEKTKKISIALKYTNGDMDKAKLMAIGSMFDVIVVKGKFTVDDQNTSGAFLVFFNFIDEYIAAIESIIELNDAFFSKTKIFDSWGIIYKNIASYENGKDTLNSAKLNGDIYNSFAQLDIFPHVQKEDTNSLSSILVDIFKECFESLNIECQIEFEKTNSLELELAGIDVMLPPIIENRRSASEVEIVFDPDSPFGKKIASTESQAQFIINGSLTISPVRGKLLSEIRPNEKIYVLLSDKDQISQKVIDTYKARDREGNPRPFLGKVISVIPNEVHKGFIIYIMVAKGIYVKIVEEENLKIQTESTELDMNDHDGNNPNKAKLAKFFNFALYGLFLLLIIILIFVLSLI